MSEIVQVAPEVLREGYTFSDTSAADFSELTELIEASTGEHISATDMQEFAASLLAEGANVRHIQVRNWLGKLAGNGTLWYEGNQGMLSNLVVHPDDQHKGIARFITAERLKIAREQQLSFMFTQLDTTNTLESYYVEHGFSRAFERENSYDGRRILTYGTEE